MIRNFEFNDFLCINIYLLTIINLIDYYILKFIKPTKVVCMKM